MGGVWHEHQKMLVTLFIDLRKNVIYSLKYVTPTLPIFRESISSKECKHPCILVMEFLPTNLTSCIEQYGILPKEISYSILHDVTLGSYYLHRIFLPAHFSLMYSSSSTVARSISHLSICHSDPSQLVGIESSKCCSHSHQIRLYYDWEI